MTGTNIEESKPSKTCRKIYNDLLSLMSEEELVNGINDNLYGGQWGVLLYLFYYERYCDTGMSNASNYLVKLYENLDTTSHNFSFCTGLSGPFWLLNHLSKNDFIDIEIDEITTDFVNLAIEYGKVYINNKNFDFLHGSAGVCNVLIEFAHLEVVQEHLSFFVNTLFSASVNTDTGLSLPFFHFYTDPPSNVGIDAFSLAHGTCSYQIILLKIYQLGIEVKKCRLMIEESMQFMLNYENKPAVEGQALFPMYTDGKTISSRVSWCYGDLNVATSLWQCGIVFNNHEWKKIAFEICKHNISRNTCSSAGVVDTCLCHGTSGNGLMYLQMWENFGDERFKKCADDWFELTHEMLEFSTEHRGIKMWQGDKRGWEYKPDFLDGSAGVGLALISENIGKTLPWKELLLL